MLFRSFDGRFFAGAALTAVILAAAGCQSGGKSMLGLGGKSEKQDAQVAEIEAKVKASDLQAYCPKVTLRDGTAFFNTYGKAARKPKKKATADDDQPSADAADTPPDESANIIYQAAITDVTRDCTRSDGQLNMKIGVAGKVVPGPLGAPGTITMPIRIAVMHGTDVLYSQIFQYKVQIADVSAATQFVFTDPNVVVPAPSASDYQVFAGYDEGGAAKKKAAAASN